MKNQNNFETVLEYLFSYPRLNSYVQQVNKTNKEAIAVLNWNTQLSQAFYPLLELLEICLRNALNDAISKDKKSDDWFRLPFLAPLEFSAIKSAELNLKKQNKIVLPHRIIAELRFGFWTSLFDVRYEQNQLLWPHLLKEVFPFAPRKARTRKYIGKKLNMLRLLRNRIFHYEPIWNR